MQQHSHSNKYSRGSTMLLLGCGQVNQLSI